MEKRTATKTRKTNETDISLTFAIDGQGRSELDTNVPFMSHMLDLFTRHGLFDLQLSAHGDTEIDDHHTTEDIGIVLGAAFHEASADKKGIKRYGNVTVPMDDALVQVVVDLSNRPHFVLHGEIPAVKVGTFDTELIEEYLWKFAVESRMNLHVVIQAGTNVHHMIEAIFKALGRALDEATQFDPRVTDVPSTKGSLS
ncbi:imidazoleglycerol-phosphate dehydratase HisB [Salisediminibacterium halotolerans]|uniref:Imidazoleglycerol-phosphate dehydratase n=1 Tax=Salisediminibacterium halotolerans TaxID=517425 RepID=A0A1H9W0S0_9BACI|nr:imidazoleglycerol-phosphate dehydratase HisB [Salisediminibacterium haloalkalitolerans]SES27540.1 imidazoleglycerol-phosphate dehydratase [Salisediminibacterium haloalkalitolerans]